VSLLLSWVFGPGEGIALGQWVSRVVMRTSVFGLIFGYCVAIGTVGRWLLDEPSWAVVFTVAASISVAAAVFLDWWTDVTGGTVWAQVVSLILFPTVLVFFPLQALDNWLERLRWPKTVDEAVDCLLRELGAEEKRLLCQDAPEIDWYCLGQGIRNSFGLWQGNSGLLRSCKVEGHPVPEDAASGVIIQLLIERLRQERAEPTDEADRQT